MENKGHYDIGYVETIARAYAEIKLVSEEIIHGGYHTKKFQKREVKERLQRAINQYRSDVPQEMINLLGVHLGNLEKECLAQLSKVT